MTHAPHPLGRAAILAAIMILVAGCVPSSNLPGPASTDAPGVSADPATGAPAADPVADSGPGDEDTPLPAPEEGDLPAVEPTPLLVGRLVLGAAEAPSRTIVGADGGTVSVLGLELAVPDGALAGDTGFTVSTVAVNGVSAGGWGGALTPLTPLYSIDNGEAPLSAPVTVTMEALLPVQAVAGTSVMAFSYDRESGALSPLSPLGWDNGILTALATHFSDIVGMAVDWSRVPAVVDSGFRPGTDDWEFDNRGSYVAPRGQCEGQTLSEIWYYGQQRGVAGAPALNGRYDNNGATPATPGLWQDDSDGYRLVASVHADPIVDLTLYQQLLAEQWGEIENRPTWDAFRAAIALSGQPQMIRISTDGLSAGHTMVVYRVNRTRLYVADPNYVGQLRTIAWDAEAEDLAPYSSGPSTSSIAADGSVEYSHFAYVPVAGARTNAAIAARWAELEAGAAGDSVFPGYTLQVSDRQDADGRPVWVPLADGFVTDQATVSIQLPNLDDGARATTAVYRDAARVPGGVWDWAQELALDPGDNDFGLSIYARIDGGWKYVDFVRLTITRDGAEATPAPRGYWELTRSEAAGGPLSVPFSRPGEATSFSISDGSVVTSHRDDGPPYRAELSLGSWGTPPVNAAPGDVWTSSLAVRGNCSCDTEHHGDPSWFCDVDTSWASGINVTITWDESGRTARQRFSTEMTCGVPGPGFMDSSGSGSTDLSWAFPPAPTMAGAPILISVGAGDQHAFDTWEYEYTWRPGGDLPQVELP